MKLGRIYQMTVQVGEFSALATSGFLASQETAKTVLISYPLTLTFDVSRNTLASANRGNFKITNLAPDTRRQIFHDRNSTLDYRRIVLQAGYEGQSPLPTIFQGNIVSAYSMRQGTDWVTEIEAFDGGYGILNGQVSQTTPKGWDLRQIIKQVLGTMPQVSPGVIGDVETGSTRGITLMGNSWDITSRIAAGQQAMAFVDNETAHVIAQGEYVPNIASLTVVSNETGLLETPRRSNALLEASLLFEPRLQVGQQISLVGLEKIYNGDYRVLGVSHRGTISGAVGGSVVTVISLELGTFSFVAAQRAA